MVEKGGMKVVVNAVAVVVVDDIDIPGRLGRLPLGRVVIP
jgi:hypothetical protein